VVNFGFKKTHFTIEKKNQWIILLKPK
jgi:hypothetical protein